jgi:signaling intermediate in Toll pathway protein
MPKGKFIPTNLFQVEFQHYPKQQQCIIDLLAQMEDNGVIPDYEMEDMLINVFGRRGHPVRKYWRMMYWMPKFKNLTPWPVPNPPPNDALELALLALERMCSVDLQSKISTFSTNEVENAIDDTWIVSGQSPTQQRLLAKHDRLEGLFIEGPFHIWLRYKCIQYFILRSEPPKNFKEKNEDIEIDDVSDIEVPIFSLGRVKPKANKVAIIRSVHEQKDGTIYAICCTGMSSKDSLLSWIRLLEKNGNPCLANLAVLFKFRSATDKELVVATQEPATT